MIFAALLFKHASFIVQHHLMASMLVQIFAYLSFMTAEAAGCSGIIAILICAFGLRNYAMRNLTQESQLLSIHLAKQISHYAETIVYIQIGIFLFFFNSLINS